MKKRLKVFISMVIILFIIDLVFFIIDYNRVRNNQLPLFSIKTEIFRDGGTSGFDETYFSANVKQDYTDDNTQETYNNPRDKVELESFTRTYKVLDIIKGNESTYTFLTIRQYQCEEVETVKVKTFLTDSIQIGNNYEFKFQYEYKRIKDNIKSIFENATLISISETDKQGIEQTQDIIRDTFTQTFRILNIIESNDSKYIYLTVRQFQCEEVETVKIKKNLASSVKANNNYEFTFRYTEKDVEDEIKSIFENMDIISIEKTDKEGLEQINEGIW